MMTNQQRFMAVARLFTLLPEWLHTNADEGAQQMDVYVIGPKGARFRLGYFHGNGFTAENPMRRTLVRHGVRCSEGRVGMNSEPQYDWFIVFNDDGNVLYMHDQRMYMEAMMDVPE